jgi:hypothetical protein
MASSRYSLFETPFHPDKAPQTSSRRGITLLSRLFFFFLLLLAVCLKIWNLVKSDCQAGEGILLKVVPAPPVSALTHLGRLTAVTAVNTGAIWPVSYIDDCKHILVD